MNIILADSYSFPGVADFHNEFIVRLASETNIKITVFG